MLSDAEMTAWRSFLRANDRVMRALDAALRADHGLTLAEYDVLIQLSMAPGRRMRMRDLARATVFSPSGLTRLCERMERSGLLGREAAGDDARGTDAVLTSDGARRLREARATHLEDVRAQFAGHIAPGELETFTTVLRRIAGEVSPPGP